MESGLWAMPAVAGGGMSVSPGLWTRLFSLCCAALLLSLACAGVRTHVSPYPGSSSRYKFFLALPVYFVHTLPKA